MNQGVSMDDEFCECGTALRSHGDGTFCPECGYVPSTIPTPKLEVFEWESWGKIEAKNVDDAFEQLTSRLSLMGLSTSVKVMDLTVAQDLD